MNTWSFSMIFLFSICICNLFKLSLCIVRQCTYTPTNYSTVHLNLNYLILFIQNFLIHLHTQNHHKLQTYKHQHFFHYSHSFCSYSSILSSTQTKYSINLNTMYKLLKATRPAQNTYLTNNVYSVYNTLND